MPTPSAPGPQTPFTFSSTCPDTDDPSPPRHDTPMDLTDGSTDHSAVAEDVSASTSADASPRRVFVASDGPVRDSDLEPSSPVDQGRPYLESHKDVDDLDIERTDSPCDPSPPMPLQTSRPRQGVGTTHTSGYHTAGGLTSKSQYPHIENAADQDYTLPSMGYGFPSRRVRPSLWNRSRQAAA